MRIEKAHLIKHPHIPRFLYKYREFSERHLDAFTKGVLWRCAAERFNDPHDAAVSFSIDRFLVEDLSPQEFIDYARKMSQEIGVDGWRPAKINRPIRQSEWIRKRVLGILEEEAISEQQRNKLMALFEELTKKWSDYNVRRMSDSFRKGYSILSLSETFSSSLMWSHYSASHTGFVIEYDFYDVGCEQLRRNCYPVLYTGKMRDATRYLARVDPDDSNVLFGIYMCLIKHKDWAYEKEWRLVLPLGPSYANVEQPMPKPSAVILGSKMSAENEKTMTDLCRVMDIPLKRMGQKPGKFELSLAGEAN